MPRLVRFCAFAAPALMLVYALLRVVDGLDGDRHNGPAWDLGHLAFFVAVALFAVLALPCGRWTGRPPPPGACSSTRRRPPCWPARPASSG